MGPIEQLLPDGVPHLAAADLLGTTAEFVALEPSLFESERDAVRAAVDRRRADYAGSRVCARAALTRIGVPAAAILNRADRSPIWPSGVVGSLTHTEGYAAAAVARSGAIASIGIDAEPDAPLPADAARKVLLDADRAAIADLPADGPAWDRLVFCVKEATYKVWFPITGCWLGFEDATVAVSADGDVRVTLLHDALIVDGIEHRTLTGRWTSAAGFLGAVITVDRPAARPR